MYYIITKALKKEYRKGNFVPLSSISLQRLLFSIKHLHQAYVNKLPKFAGDFMKKIFWAAMLTLLCLSLAACDPSQGIPNPFLQGYGGENSTDSSEQAADTVRYHFERPQIHKTVYAQAFMNCSGQKPGTFFHCV